MELLQVDALAVANVRKVSKTCVDEPQLLILLYPKNSESVELASLLSEFSASSFSVSYCQISCWSPTSTSNFSFLSLSIPTYITEPLQMQLLIPRDQMSAVLLPVRT
jgi:hypothetical protein